MSPELDRELRRMVVLSTRVPPSRRRRALRVRQELVLRGGRPRTTR